MISIQHKLEQVHPGFAYELLQLQMAVEDQKLAFHPSIIEITKLIQLYMIGVQVLQSLSDQRFQYFNHKIHTLMLKKHIVTKLHQASGGIGTPTIPAVNRAQLQDKKSGYEVNCFLNQGQVDIRTVKQMLSAAQNKKIQVETIIHLDIKKQQDRLQERIRERKMKSEAGSVKKLGIGNWGNIDSPDPHKRNSDPRMEYFDFPGSLNSQKNHIIFRTTSNSLQKKILQRKLDARKHFFMSYIQEKECKDAI